MINGTPINFRGKAYYNTNAENPRGGGGKENTAQNILRCPKEIRGKIIGELNSFKTELEERTPKEDEFGIEFKCNLNNCYFPPSIYLSVKDLNNPSKYSYVVSHSEDIGYDSDKKFSFFEEEKLSKTIDKFFSKIKEEAFYNIEKMHNQEDDESLKSIMDRLI